MISTKLRVESGLQMLSRLTKKSSLENFCPKIFENGPKFGEFIEIHSEHSTKCLLIDLLCESLIHSEINGTNANILIFNTNGSFDLDYFLRILKTKLDNEIQINPKKNLHCSDYELKNVDSFLESMIKKVYVLNIYEAHQFYTSVQNIENMLAKQPNITLLVFDTISAFYWSEQNFKITKMDSYLKNILLLIKKAIKDIKVSVLYTRPEYFSSIKENIESSNDVIGDLINYKIQVAYHENEPHCIIVRTHQNKCKHNFIVTTSGISWM